MASFFTPASQRPKERTVWSERGPDDDTPATLLVGRHEPDAEHAGDEGDGRRKRCKIAAFDLVSVALRLVLHTHVQTS